ncbi:hypothetical protein NL108_016208, partial [Boleophthalmus pectinirostris]
RLSSGKLQDLGISDGSKLTLVPTVEAGLMSQASRPEQSVMQALESLTETQVSDFLSGRSPLTLALRVGDHMMFVQLQLAAQQSGGPQLQHRHVITRGSGDSSVAQPTGQPRVPHPHPHHHPQHPHSPSSHVSPPHPSSTPSPVPLSFPMSSTHHQPLPPMYHQSASSAHCSPPTPPPPPHSPRPSHMPASLFRSPAHHHHHHHYYHQPSSSQSGHSMSQPSPANCSSTTSPNSGSSSSSRSRKPGAIIESFVNHAPGVFSGTFSGTLHPNCQDSTGRPRRDISTILQILNDLLSATRHYQGMPPSLTQLRYQTQCGSPTSPSPPPSPPVTGMAELAAKATSVPSCSRSSPPPALHPLVQCQSEIHMCKPP